jgi:hypothetical protein
LHECLVDRREGIKEEITARATLLSGAPPVEDPEYRVGLRLAVDGAVEYCLAALPAETERLPAVPAAISTQARRAARQRVGLHVSLRRCFAGHSLLCDRILEEATRSGGGGADIRAVLQRQAAAVDRISRAISAAYAEEAEAEPRSMAQRQAQRIDALLAGEPVDVSSIKYRFEGSHLALAARGDAATAIRQQAGQFAFELLLVTRQPETIWAWLGARAAADYEAFLRELCDGWPDGAMLGISECCEGIEGWRLTQRQARTALMFARHKISPIVRYADISLSAAILADEVLAASLRRRYLVPLSGPDGQLLRETLRAYIECGANVSSAAAALGVNRHTVTNRLRRAEERIDRPLRTCMAELQAVLRLEQLGT